MLVSMHRVQDARLRLLRWLRDRRRKLRMLRSGIPYHAHFPERAFRDVSESFHHHTGRPIRSVLDVGANFGQCALFLQRRLRLSPSDIVCVEAHPTLAQLLQSRTGFEVLHGAVGLTRSPRSFLARPVDVRMGTVFDVMTDRIGSVDRSGMSSSLVHGHDSNQDVTPTDVPGIHLETYLNSTGRSFDLLKVDIEGAGLQGLQSLGERIDRIASIHIEAETRPIWEGQSLWPEVHSLLISHGFELTLYRLDRYFLQCESYWIRSSLIRSFVDAP